MLQNLPRSRLTGFNHSWNDKIFPPRCLASSFCAVLVAASIRVTNWIVRHRVLPKTLPPPLGEQNKLTSNLSLNHLFIQVLSIYHTKGQFSYYFKRSTTPRSVFLSLSLDLRGEKSTLDALTVWELGLFYVLCWNLKLFAYYWVYLLRKSYFMHTKSDKKISSSTGRQLLQEVQITSHTAASTRTWISYLERWLNNACVFRFGFTLIKFTVKLWRGAVP